MDYGDDPTVYKKPGKQHNVLPLWGNEASMNLNPLILANIQGSSYFKVHLFKLKTYHEVVDEIYYQVKHLEPWERGSRKTAGQTGMCGGVRGVGAGGIVSTAFCLLYKLYTLRLTRKQVNGLLTHSDSPYIRALGFMYIRFTQPPSDLFDWYEEYLDDEEEIDVKAGGGQMMTIGMMARQWLTKLDWFSTLFPRIPVPIQKQIEKRLHDYLQANPQQQMQYQQQQQQQQQQQNQQQQQQHQHQQHQQNHQQQSQQQHNQQQQQQQNRFGNSTANNDNSYAAARRDQPDLNADRDRDRDSRRPTRVRSRERDRDSGRDRSERNDRDGGGGGGRREADKYDNKNHRDRDRDYHRSSRNASPDKYSSRNRSRDRRHR